MVQVAKLGKFNYNTSFQSAAHTIPFEVVYGRPPPALQQYLPGEIRVQSVLEMLKSRDEILRQLSCHLDRAQQRMVREANKRRRDVHVEVGEAVYLKYRPFRQSTLFKPEARKLAPRFYGPFKIVRRIGTSAYRLQLPTGSKVHPVFHVSLLKRAVGNNVTESVLPDEMKSADPPYLLELVAGRRCITRDGERVPQVLIQWSGIPVEEATWMDEADVAGQFPFFCLGDKASSAGRALDAPLPWRVYKKRGTTASRSRHYGRQSFGKWKCKKQRLQ